VSIIAEIEILREVKGTIDELNIIKSVLMKQNSLLRDAKEFLGLPQELGSKLDNNSTVLIKPLTAE
jgi:hypothetical protein